jgi:hypothetical protein
MENASDRIQKRNNTERLNMAAYSVAAYLNITGFTYHEGFWVDLPNGDFLTVLIVATGEFHTNGCAISSARIVNTKDSYRVYPN